MASTLEIPSIPNPLAPQQPQLQPPSAATGDQVLELAPASANPRIAAQAKVGIDDLVRAIVMQESSGDPNAKGKAGEIGLMQITPGLAAQYGVDPARLTDPATNLWVGHRYLDDLWKRYNGNVNLVLTAYNAGPHRADTGYTPASTKKYISSIWNRLGSAMEGTAYADELPAALKGAREVPAPWASSTPAAMSGAAETANPYGTAAPSPSSGLEGAYERNIAAPATTAVTGAVDRIAPGWGKTAGSALVPQNLTSAGIDLGLMATGLGEMGLLARLAIPAIGGAAGAYASGGSAISGAAQGAGSALGGEMIAGLTGIAGRGLLSSGVTGKTTADVSETIGDTLGRRLGMMPPKDSAMFERTFALGGASRQAGKIAEGVSQQANTALRGRLLDIGIGHPVSLREAENVIEALNDGTYTVAGTLKGVQGRGAMLKQSFAIRGIVERQLNAIQPGLGSVWRQSRRDLGAARVLQRLFREPDVFVNGQMNQPQLEKLISTKYWDQLNNTLGADDSVKLLNSIRRGAKGPAARDVAGRGVDPHVSMGGHVRLGLPRTTKQVGDVPSVMNRAATNPARVPGGLAVRRGRDWLGRPIDQQ